MKPVRIYYVAHCRFPSPRAHAIQIAKMAEAMQLSGTDVHLIVPRRNSTIAKSPREFYGLRTDIPVQYLPVLDCYAWGRIGYIVSGCSFVVAYWLFLFRKKLRGEHFSLYTIDMDQFSFIAISFLGTPFVMEVHSAKRYGVLLNRMFTRARAILTINAIIKDELVTTFAISPEKIIVFPNGIDVDLFAQTVDRNAWRKEWSIAKEAPLALYVGRCYDWKGIEIFHETFQRIPGVTFGFVGCTKDEFEKVTGKQCAYANAFFFGERPYAEMPRWMKSADILLVIGTKKNEYSYYQTSPMKLFEYMSSGVPVLAAHTPALRDMVSDTQVFFYEPDDAEDFSRNIEEILGNVPRARQFASRAERYAQTFSWENRVKIILQTLPH